MAYSNLNNTQNYQLASFGQNGFDYLKSGNLTVTGNHWNAIQVLETASITALTSVSGDSISSAQTVNAGTVIYGLFTTVTISSGVVLAYKA